MFMSPALAVLATTMFAATAFAAPMWQMTQLQQWRWGIEEIGKHLFHVTDTNGDNYISFDEVKEALAKMFNREKLDKSQRLRNEFFSADSDANGQLSLAEFIAHLQHYQENLAEGPKLFIELLDGDADGMISYEEFVEFIHANNDVNPREDLMHQLFRMFDMDGNGQIEEQELVELERRFFGELGILPPPPTTAMPPSEYETTTDTPGAQNRNFLERTFHQWDANDDNYVSWDELKEALAKMFKPEEVDKSERLWDHFAAVDSDGDGLMSHAEFIGSFENDKDVTEWAKIFIELVDGDADGMISYEEFAELARANNGAGMSEEWLHQIFQAYDKNRNGQIDVDDLVELFRHHRPGTLPPSEYETTTSNPGAQNRSLLPNVSAAAALLEHVRSIRNMFYAIDRDANGNIDFGEFLEFILMQEMNGLTPNVIGHH